ncbi:MAG TPA: hypothetical protein VN836_11230 [Verrucomicrobiae bacterium]|nr:hypothetical protein [Verrucomicrobiae bacterium]
MVTANLDVACATTLRNNPGVQLVTRSNCAAILAALALVFKVSAQAPLVVYDDGLQNGFSDWNWKSHSLINTSFVHSGTFSISVNATNWSGLHLQHAEFDTSPYASLSFWVNGGTNGGQRLQVQALLGNNNPPANVYYRFTLLPGTWQQITVPLTSLGVAGQTNCTGFWIQLTPNCPSGAFYVDDIQFNPKPVVMPATVNTNAMSAMAAAGPTARANGANWNVIGWCIAGALIVITALLACLIVMLRRSGLGTSKALLPASPPAALQIGPGPAAGGAPGAQPHLLTAETLAGPQAQALREKMASELTEFAKQSLVQGLYSQRSQLIEAQQKARQELAELEARLASLHLPLQERIRAYETRIAELEKQLETRDGEMREMIRATLLLLRERMEKEKAGGFDIPRFN